VSETHQILEIGLAMEQSRVAAPKIPLFQTPREIAALARAWLQRRRVASQPAGGPTPPAATEPANAEPPPEEKT
jgi:hypothetical protein